MGSTKYLAQGPLALALISCNPQWNNIATWAIDVAFSFSIKSKLNELLLINYYCYCKLLIETNLAN